MNAVKADYYSSYEKLRKIRYKDLTKETPEYGFLAERYPHLAESLRLKKEREKLREQLRALKEYSKRFQIKRELANVEMKLNRERLLKRLRGEEKQEIIFNLHFIKNQILFLIRGLYTNSQGVYRGVYRNLRNLQNALWRSVLRRMPPSLLDLRSLDAAERGLVLMDWIRAHREKLLPPTKKASMSTET